MQGVGGAERECEDAVGGWVWFAGAAVREEGEEDAWMRCGKRMRKRMEVATRGEVKRLCALGDHQKHNTGTGTCHY